MDQFDKLQHPSTVWEPFWSLYLNGYYRPIVTLSLVLDAHIGGLAPWIYHCSNVVVHAIVCWLLFYFLRRLSVAPLTALMACLLFAVHPVVTQAVAWILGRNDTLVVMFLLLTLLAYMNYRESGRWYWILLHWICAGMALSTKETALIFPGMIFIYEIIFFRESWFSRRLVVGACGWPFLIGGWYIVKQTLLAGQGAQISVFSFGAIVTNIRVLLEAFGKLFLPLQLSPYPTYSLLPTIAGIVAVVVSVFLVRRSNSENRLRIFAIAFMLLFLLPGMFIHFDYNEQRFDYLESRLYGVAIGFAVFITDVFYDRRLSFFSIRTKIMGIALPILGVLTIIYSGTFSDPLTHWRRAVEMSPRSSHAYFEMGLSVSKVLRDPAKAVGWYRKAIRMDSNIAMYHNNLGVAYGALGLQPQAKEEYQIAINLDSTYLAAYGNLGYSEFLIGNYDRTEAHWKHILAIDSTFPNVELELARLYVIWKKYPEARYHIRKLRAHGVPLDSLLTSVPDE